MFPEDYIMPFGICIGKRLHFNLLVKKNGIIYRLEPYKHVSLQYNAVAIDTIFNSIPVYGNKNGKTCVLDAFKMIANFHGI